RALSNHMSRKKKEKNASSRKKSTSSSVWEYFSELTQTIKEEIQNIAKHLPGPWFRYQNILDVLNIPDPKLPDQRRQGLDRGDSLPREEPDAATIGLGDGDEDYAATLLSARVI